MNRKRNRLLWIFVIGCVLSLAAGLFLYAAQNWVSFAMNPKEAKTLTQFPSAPIRLYGLVKVGSIGQEGAKVRFIASLEGFDVSVTHEGELPALFREGQGVIAEGRMMNENLFRADRILAKHDEKYVPRELVDTLKEQGVWRGDSAQGAPSQ